MELETLCEFAEVARQKSFSRAAEELHLSQPSLSKHIMALEKELGLRLFDRTSRKVTLSQAGQRLLPYVEQAQELYRQMLALAKEERSLSSSRVCVASIPVMAQYGITDAIAAFERVYPDVALEVRECESRDIAGVLASGECELAFTRDTTDWEDVETAPFCQDQLVAVLPAGHALAGAESVSLRQLKDEDFLLLDSGTFLYQLCLGLCRQEGFEPRIRYTGKRPENILGLAAAGMGVALLMRQHTLHQPNVAVVPVTPQVESDICLVRKNQTPPSACAELFWNFIRDYQA